MEAGYDIEKVPNNILHERVMVMRLSKEKGLNACWNNQLLTDCNKIFNLNFGA